LGILRAREPVQTMIVGLLPGCVRPVRGGRSNANAFGKPKRGHRISGSRREQQRSETTCRTRTRQASTRSSQGQQPRLRLRQ
jgi:hypothetical protein